MTVRVLRSTDTDAPVLTGQTGTLLALLNACLVDGFGAKSPLGWTREFSESGSRAVFRNDSVGGSGQRIWVRDDISTHTRWARIYGAKEASAIDTLTGMFPSQVTINTVNAGCCISKSATSDATVRPWVMIGDERTFILLIQTGEVANEWCGTYAGDIDSITGSDIFALFARWASGWTQAITSTNASPMTASAPVLSAEEFGTQNPYVTRTSQNSTMDGHIAEHPVSGQACPAMNRLAADGRSNIASQSGGYGSAYPAVGGGILMAKNQLVLGSSSVCHIGTQRGVWSPLHNRPLSNNDTFSGSGEFAGKTFEAFNLAQGGQLIIETSDTW